MQTALSYSGARVFVDACKDAYRLRHFRRLKELDLHVVYLVRDLRGVVLSNLELKKPGWDAMRMTRMWLHQQRTILRILSEFPSVMTIYYEDLIDMVDETLATIHRFVGLTPQQFSGDFKTVEHHVLGNTMRLSDTSKIVKSRRWQQELSGEALEAISRTALAFVQEHKHHPLAKIIEHYLYQQD
jgi:hypothetical protein